MPRPLHDSEYLYGFHDPGGERHMLEKGIPGWVLVTEALRSDTNDQTGRNYQFLSDNGLGVIGRLNAGYDGVGTIPREADYANFARRCANFVRNSTGCNIWIVGNEPNHPIEWPGGESGEKITPQRYAKCYRMVRDAIHSLPGRSGDQVVIAGPAPWNAQLAYPGNDSGDWVQYFQDVLQIVGPQHCDAISIHTYTHGSDPHLITSDARMAAPFAHRLFEFRAYRDFMSAIPTTMHHLPVYITETDQTDPWHNENKAWVQRAYGEIDDWNKHNFQKIRSLLLYRWPKSDKWYIDGKQGVIEDFRQALDYRYKWQVGPTEDIPVLPAHRARFSLAIALRECQVGQEITLPMTVRNQGSDTWAHTGAGSVSMGYHWLDASGNQVPGIPDHRTALPKSVRTNEEVRITATIAAPRTPGAFNLVLDMVNEPNKWFAEAGNKVATVAVKVAAAPVVEEQWFPETKIWVRGAFLEFYRRYGLEICGYPITDAITENGLPAQYFQRVALEQVESAKVRLKLTAQQALDAQKRIAELEKQVQDLVRLAPRGGAPKPDLQDITARLPRDPAGLTIRQDSDIQHVVIHHTGVAGVAAVDRVAAIYRQRNYPAIIGQFYVDYDGAIYQTNGINEVVSDELAWAKNGVSILVAGNFSQGVPSESQMNALSALCAWLLDAYRLDTAAVKGVSEGFARTQSPGTNWLTGLHWKNALVLLIASLRSSSSAGAAALLALSQDRDRLAALLQDAQDQIAVLRTALERALESQPRTVPQPALRDITATLSREAGKLFKRADADVKYIVINHTGVPASIGPDRIAQAHRARWPAIIGQYYIADDGEILQTNAANEVVDDKQDWLFRAINVFVAGSFDVDVPTDKQVNNLAALVVWLQQQYGLADDAIRGVSEFIVTRSPGEQWLNGKNWKKSLLDRVAIVRASFQASPGVDTAALSLLDAMRRQIGDLKAQDQDLVRQADAFRDQAIAGATEVETLQAQLIALQAANQTLTNERSQLNETIIRLNATIALLQKQIADLGKQQPAPGNDTAPGQLVKPVMQELVDSLIKSTTGAYESRTLDKITHICVHHSAAPASITPERIAEYHVNTHGWAGIGYHYYVGPDGAIYHTQDLGLISYHVYMNNSYSIGVCLAGDFTDVGPTPAQVEAAGKLIAWLMQELSIPLGNIWGHKEFPDNMTACPGRQWLEGLQWKQTLLSSIGAARGDPAPSAGKSIDHYVLFWQHEDGSWAQQDWQGAINYIARFRPTVGFSVDDARQASRITIVGGVGGVSQKDEEALRAAGCKVERLAGRDYDETKALLDRLAQSGKPFLSLS